MRKRNSPRTGKVSSHIKGRLAGENRRVAAKSGLPPGSLVHVGKRATEGVRISIIRYDRDRVQVTESAGVQHLRELPDSAAITWIIVEGLHAVETIEAICRHFQFHPLVTEDILNTTQRPKIEDLGDYVFIVLRILNQETEPPGLGSEQVSMVLGPKYVITFLEGGGQHFSDLRNRIQIGKGRIRTAGSDYLAYCILDSIVDKYFDVLEDMAERMERLEEDVITDTTPDTVHEIHRLKTDMIFLRRSIWPARDVASVLLSGGSSLIQEATLPYLRDVYDHTIRVIDIMETYRDVASGMLDIYLSSVSNRLNQIMKVLTIIATIFIPLTFLSGWYGMNFKNMPELGWRWGYPMVIVIAVSVVAGMLLLFRRKGWI